MKLKTKSTKLKKYLSFGLFFLSFVFTSAVSFADRSGDQGWGVMVGNPSGVSGKIWLDDRFAVDLAAGVARSELDIHTSILWHHFNWAKGSKSRILSDITSRGKFPFYIGIGPRFLFEHNEEFGIRFPVGLSFFPNESRWEFFGEVAPVLRLTPDSGFNGDFAVGVRYYFPAIRPRDNNK